MPVHYISRKKDEDAKWLAILKRVPGDPRSSNFYTLVDPEFAKQYQGIALDPDLEEKVATKLFSRFDAEGFQFCRNISKTTIQESVAGFKLSEEKRLKEEQLLNPEESDPAIIVVDEVDPEFAKQYAGITLDPDLQEKVQSGEYPLTEAEGLQFCRNIVKVHEKEIGEIYAKKIKVDEEDTTSPKFSSGAVRLPDYEGLWSRSID